MQKFEVKISKQKRRVRIIRDPKLIDEEIEKYNASKYLRNLLLKSQESEEQKQKRLEEEEIQRKEDEDQEREEKERRKRLEELKAKEKTEVKFYQEFHFTNQNKPVNIDLSKVQEDSIPLSIAKEQIQRAYEDGMQDGQISAMSTYKTEIEKYQEWVRRFDATADNLKKEQIKSINKIEESLIELSVLISQQILNKEIEKDENLVVNQVRKAIESIRTESIFKIDVHPEAYEILKEVKSKIIEDYQLNEDIKIHPNPTVPMGSCLLETSAGLIDGRIKNQLNKIASELEDEASRIIQTEEMQDEMNDFYNKTKEDDFIEDPEDPDPNDLADNNFDADNMSYEDIPDEYKEMFSDDIFGESDMDSEGNIIEEPEVPEEENDTEIDYSKLDQDSENDDFYDEPDNNKNNDTDPRDIDRDFDNLFNN